MMPDYEPDEYASDDQDGYPWDCDRDYPLTLDDDDDEDD